MQYETESQKRTRMHHEALALCEANKDKIRVFDNTHSGFNVRLISNRKQKAKLAFEQRQAIAEQREFR